MNYLKNKQLTWLITGAFMLILLTQSNAQEGNSRNEDPCEKQNIIRICQTGNWHEGDAEYSPCSDNSVWGTNIGTFSDEVEILISAYAVDIPGAIKYNRDDSGLHENSFPSGFPDPYLRYEYSPNNFRYTEVLTNWIFVQQVEGDDCNLYDLYSASKLVKILLPESERCDQDDATLNFSIDLSLATYASVIEDYIDYPLATYGEAHEIFSCNIFDETKHICDPKLTDDGIQSEVEICIPCHIYEGNPEGRNAAINEDNKIKILTNPFSETLTFDFDSKEETNLNVSLITANGELILRESFVANRGTNQFIISAQNITSGIYYLSIITKRGKYSQKVVCIN